jgi:AcrR family transcriptional regulator
MASGRAAARDARRTDILAAAIRVLAREGVAETTTRMIAAEAQVNQATLRYYFGSKDDLLLAVLQEMMRRTHEVVMAAAPLTPALAAPGGLRAAIAESVTAFWAHVEAEPELQQMQQELTHYALRRPESAWLTREQYGGYTAVVEAIFREAFMLAGQASVTPFDALARFVIAGIDGLILQYLSDRDAARARRDLACLIAAVGALAESGGANDVAGGEVSDAATALSLPSPTGRGS